MKNPFQHKLFCESELSLMFYCPGLKLNLHKKVSSSKTSGSLLEFELVLSQLSVLSHSLNASYEQRIYFRKFKF